MNNVLKTIEIDLYSPTSYKVIKAQQGDHNSRIIEPILSEQGKPYQISDNIYSAYTDTPVDYVYNDYFCTIRIRNIKDTSPVNSSIIASLPENIRPPMTLAWDYYTPSGGVIRLSVSSGNLFAYRYNNNSVYNIGATLTYALH